MNRKDAEKVLNNRIFLELKKHPRTSEQKFMSRLPWSLINNKKIYNRVLDEIEQRCEYRWYGDICNPNKSGA